MTQSSTLSEVLKLKHCDINYHRVRKPLAGKITRYADIDFRRNLADSLTKPLSGTTLFNLVNPVLFENLCKSLQPGNNMHLKSNKGNMIHDLDSKAPDESKS